MISINNNITKLNREGFQFSPFLGSCRLRRRPELFCYSFLEIILGRFSCVSCGYSVFYLTKGQSHPFDPPRYFLPFMPHPALSGSFWPSFLLPTLLSPIYAPLLSPDQGGVLLRFPPGASRLSPDGAPPSRGLHVRSRLERCHGDLEADGRDDVRCGWPGAVATNPLGLALELGQARRRWLCSVTASVTNGAHDLSSISFPIVSKH